MSAGRSEYTAAPSFASIRVHWQFTVVGRQTRASARSKLVFQQCPSLAATVACQNRCWQHRQRCRRRQRESAIRDCSHLAAGQPVAGLARHRTTRYDPVRRFTGAMIIPKKKSHTQVIHNAETVTGRSD
jgi:hypothetical protein